MLYDFKEGLKQYEITMEEEEERKHQEWYEAEKFECFFCAQKVCEDDIEIRGDYGDVCKGCYHDRKHGTGEITSWEAPR